MAYHKLLHIRTRALKESGDPRKRRCTACGEYDDIGNMEARSTSFAHRRCVLETARRDYWRKKGMNPPEKVRAWSRKTAE